MEIHLIELAKTHGVWAALSIGLIFYVLKAQERRDVNQEAREERYQKIIMELTANLDVMNSILDHVSEIKVKLSDY